MSKILSAHQPNFIPYLGFFDKIKSSDIFVIRDEVLFVDSDFHHRNKIRINSNDNTNNPQSKWISVPVENKNDFILHTPVKKLTLRNGKPWNLQMLHDLKANYSGAKHFNEHYPAFEKILDNSDEKLIEINMKIIRYLMSVFKIDTEIAMASELGLKAKHYEKTDASEDLALICERLGADVYLSGSGGKDYLNLEPFNRRGIKVIFQEYKHPVYAQKFPGFLPYMAAVDALFCTGGLPIHDESQQYPAAQQHAISSSNIAPPHSASSHIAPSLIPSSNNLTPQHRKSDGESEDNAILPQTSW